MVSLKLPRTERSRLGTFLAAALFSSVVMVFALPSQADGADAVDTPIGDTWSEWRAGDIEGSTWKIVGGVSIKDGETTALD